MATQTVWASGFWADGFWADGLWAGPRTNIFLVDPTIEVVFVKSKVEKTAKICGITTDRAALILGKSEKATGLRTSQDRTALLRGSGTENTCIGGFYVSTVEREMTGTIIKQARFDGC